jgi:hypothetical protein
LGDRISDFMRRLGEADRIFVVLSDRYLRSSFCMFELSEIWRNSRQDPAAFLERVRIYNVDNVKIWEPEDWSDWAIFWKERHDALEEKARTNGLAILGQEGNRRLFQMQRYYTQVADILANLVDIVQPRSFEELERYGFDGLDRTPADPPPHDHPAKPSETAPAADDLLRRLNECSETDLISFLLGGKLEPSNLDRAIAANPTQATDFALSAMTKDGGWLHGLAGYIAARVPLDEAAIASTFGHVGFWGAALNTASLLRFCPRAKRESNKNRIFARFEKAEIDEKRLAILLLGYLDGYSALDFITYNYDISSDKYLNEKLGPYLTQSYLHAFVHYSQEWHASDIVDTALEIFKWLENHNNMHLHEFDFQPIFSVATQGVAAELLRRLYPNGPAVIITPLLWRLKEQPPPHLIALLKQIASGGPSPLTGEALRVIGRIKSPDAFNTLSQLQKSMPEAGAAILSVVGVNGLAAELPRLLRVVDDASPGQGAYWDALWSFGELAAKAGVTDLSPLERARDGDDPVVRGVAWLGLAKAGRVTDPSDLKRALQAATNFVERVIIGVAGAMIGYPAALEEGLHAAMLNHAPVWRLEADILGDLRSALRERCGEVGKLMHTLLEIGDVG